MLTLIWRPKARESVRSIFTYISERNTAAADDLLSRLNACAERISDHPYMYRAGRKEGTREAVIHPNYILVYLVGTYAVEIIDIMHTRRQYPPHDG